MGQSKTDTEVIRERIRAMDDRVGTAMHLAQDGTQTTVVAEKKPAPEPAFKPAPSSAPLYD